MTDALVLEQITKNFGAKRAVDALSLTVPRGSLVGLVGPNGAGKTTTLSMATGLLRPDYGRVLVEGVDMWADPPAAKTLMGVLPDGLRLFDRHHYVDSVDQTAVKIFATCASNCSPTKFAFRCSYFHFTFPFYG